MRRIFISYRREDSAGHAGPLYDHLCQHLGERGIFKDVMDIKPGENWRRAIEEAIDDSAVLLVVIGRKWLSVSDNQGRRRLALPDDMVRHEVASGLARAACVIPVLVDGASMPTPDELPEDLRALTDLEAVELRDSHWDPDIRPLLVTLRPIRCWRWKNLAAVTLGLVVAMVGAGFLAESSYARLLGLDEVILPGSSPVLSGAQFLINLATTLLGVLTVALVVLLLGTGLALAVRRLFPGWSPKSWLLAVRSRAGILLAAQVVAGVVFILFSLAAFADLMPLAALPSRSGILSAPRDLILRGPELYRMAVLLVLGVCLIQVGLEVWRRYLRRSALGRGTWTGTLSQVFSFPLYLVCALELLLLPVGHGLLKLPNARQHISTVVKFDDRVANTALKGRTLLLLSLRGGSGEQTYFCPSPPRTWRGIGEGQLVFTREKTAGTIVELAEEFANLDQCVASDPEEPVPAWSGGST